MKKAFVLASLLLSGIAYGGDDEVTLTIENHQMKPSLIEIPEIGRAHV